MKINQTPYLYSGSLEPAKAAWCCVDVGMWGGKWSKCELRYVIKDGGLQRVEIRTWKKDRQVELSTGNISRLKRWAGLIRKKRKKLEERNVRVSQRNKQGSLRWEVACYPHSEDIVVTSVVFIDWPFGGEEGFEAVAPWRGCCRVYEII